MFSLTEKNGLRLLVGLRIEGPNVIGIIEKPQRVVFVKAIHCIVSMTRF